MEDIAPDLLETLQRAFRENLAADKSAAALMEKIASGDTGYADALDYAGQIGEALAKAFRENLNGAMLPDEKLYWNIADRVVRPLLQEDHALAADAAVQVQEALNRAAGIGLKAQRAPLDEDRVYGIVNKLAEAERYEDVHWLLQEPVRTFSRSVVDDTLRANAEFQSSVGLKPRIRRRTVGKCCAWCQGLAGSYDYPYGVPREVYQRHENCRCVVEYDPGSGKRQNVHTKKWTAPGERDMIEERKQIGLSKPAVFRPKRYRDTLSRYVPMDRDAVLADAAANKDHRHGGVYTQAQTKTMSQLKKSIASRSAQVERHADKIAHPEAYIQDWNERSLPYRTGILEKWKKDMKRNAEQAEIELAVFEKRFGQ